MENLFPKLKYFRNLAMRYDKITRNYAAKVAPLDKNHMIGKSSNTPFKA